jgi:hypothetical protein
LRSTWRERSRRGTTGRRCSTKCARPCPRHDYRENAHARQPGTSYPHLAGERQRIPLRGGIRSAARMAIHGGAARARHCSAYWRRESRSYLRARPSITLSLKFFLPSGTIPLRLGLPLRKMPWQSPHTRARGAHGILKTPTNPQESESG